MDQNQNTKQLRKNFFIFILTVFTLLIISFSLISIFSVQKSLKKVYTKFINKEIDLISKTFNSQISSNIIASKDLTHLPIIVNSVMNPNENKAFLKDFMGDLKILGEKPDLWLIDINGDPIQNNKIQQTLPFSPSIWIDDLIEGKSQHFIRLFIYNNKPYTFLAVPVLYNGHPEGALVSITESKLEDFLKILVKSDVEYAFKVLSEGKKVIESTPLQNPNPIKRSIEMPLFQGQLHLEIDPQNINDATQSLIFLILLTAIGVSILLLLPIKRLGANLIVKPQAQLEKTREETQKLNKKLLVANDELKEFAYRISHDLKSPMATIQGLSNFIIEDIEDKDFDAAIEGVEKIQKNSFKLEELVTNILELANIEFIEEAGEEIQIESLVKDIQDKLEFLIKKHEVNIHLNLKHTRPLKTQKTRFNQIIDNLISNAVKYSNPEREHRSILVESENTNREFVLRVIDNGLGIPKEYQDKVFNMFSRFHQSQSSGSGLGLYILKKHVQLLNANIELDSSPKGSTFTIRFPQ